MLYICFHLHNIVSCSKALEEFFLSQFCVTFTSSNFPGYQFHIPGFLTPLFIYVHTEMSVLKIASMIHKNNIITISLRHNGLERVRMILLYLSTYLYINSVVSQKNSDYVLHVSCLQFSLFSVGILHIFLVLF